MIVNHEYKFVWVHVPRTGGNSVREMLEGKNWRNQKKKYIFHRDYDNIFPEYFSFGFIRNPWERIYSMYRASVKYHGIEEKRGITSFKQYLYEYNHQNMWRHKKSALKQLKGVDYIARFENLDEEWNYIFNRVGMDPARLPHRRQGAPKKPLAEVYDKKTDAFIRKYHADDIEYGNYKLV